MTTTTTTSQSIIESESTISSPPGLSFQPLDFAVSSSAALQAEVDAVNFADPLPLSAGAISSGTLALDFPRGGGGGEGGSIDPSSNSFKDTTPAEATTIYHLYRSGHAQQNFSLHTTPDTTLSPYLSKRGYRKVLRKCIGKKSITPETDPRALAYFLHTPRIKFHRPPKALRFGGGKVAPVVCLIDGSWGWRVWKIWFVAPEVEVEERGGRSWGLGWFEGRKKGQGSKREEEESKTEQEKKVNQHNRSDSDSSDLETPKDTLPTKPSWKGLNEPGVMDPRGVVVSRYPLREFGHIFGETGKAFHLQEVQRPKSLASLGTSSSSSGSPPLQESRLALLSGKTKTLFRNFGSEPLPPGVDAATVERMLPPAPEEQDLPEHLKPSSLADGSLTMRWTGWLTREYEFQYRGVEYRWKGTGTVNDSKYVGLWCRFNHLKLVAILPGEEPEEDESVEEERNPEQPKGSTRGHSLSSLFSRSNPERQHGDLSRQRSSPNLFSPPPTGKTQGPVPPQETPKNRGQEVVLATYTSLIANRKCGRFEIFEEALERMANPEANDDNDNDNDNGYDVEKIKQEIAVEKERLRHVVVSTGISMVKGEQEKRETIKKIIEVLAGAAGWAA